jgi:hypothetical protein
MKKTVTTLLMVTGIFALSHAQSKKTTEFGVSAGINAASVISKSQYGYLGNLWTPNFAVSAEQFINDRWGIKAKVIYDTKGWGNGFFNVGDEDLSGIHYPLTYLTIPITANVHFGYNNMCYGSAGPYVGVLLSATNNYNNADIKNSFNTVDVGGSAAFGIQKPLNNSLKIFFEYEAQLGFSDIVKNSATRAQNFRSAFNIGLKF